MNILLAVCFTLLNLFATPEASNISQREVRRTLADSVGSLVRLQKFLQSTCSGTDASASFQEFHFTLKLVSELVESAKSMSVSVNPEEVRDMSLYTRVSRVALVNAKESLMSRKVITESVFLAVDKLTSFNEELATLENRLENLCNSLGISSSRFNMGTESDDDSVSSSDSMTTTTTSTSAPPAAPAVISIYKTKSKTSGNQNRSVPHILV